MKSLYPLTAAALLLAPLAGIAQQSSSPTNTVCNHLWLFGYPPDGNAGYPENAGYRGGSRMTPIEGVHWLGVPNLLFLTQDHHRPQAVWFEGKWLKEGRVSDLVIPGNTHLDIGIPPPRGCASR